MAEPRRERVEELRALVDRMSADVARPPASVSEQERGMWQWRGRRYVGMYLEALQAAEAGIHRFVIHVMQRTDDGMSVDAMECTCGALLPGTYGVDATAETFADLPGHLPLPEQDE